MKKIKYHVLSPGGNMTALINEFYPRDQHAAIAKIIIEKDPSIEQVGFIESASFPKAKARLQMMGGEFCGNATRSAAFLLNAKKDKNFLMETSGFPEPVNVKNGAELIMPGKFLKRVRRIKNLYIVDLCGIRHIVIFSKISVNKAKSLVSKYKEDLPAIGVIACAFNKDVIKITPLVWVRDTNSFITETGCASGSIAVAIVAKMIYRKNQYSIVQPSGNLYVVKITIDGHYCLKGEVQDFGEREVTFD